MTARNNNEVMPFMNNSKTLLQILVEELPKRGGWPDGAAGFVQDYDGQAKPFAVGSIITSSPSIWNRGASGSMEPTFYLEKASDRATAIITRAQYEAALAAKNDGWIEWNGGDFAFVNGAIIDVKYRNGGVEGGITFHENHKKRWRISGAGDDIIAYRLSKPQEAEQEAEQEADLNECIGQDQPEWNGEGLPPVGVECEYKRINVNCSTFFSRGKVLAFGTHNVFMEHCSSETEFIRPLSDIIFRPIRTEREKAIKEMLGCVINRDSASVILSVEQLYDAGYRKQ